MDFDEFHKRVGDVGTRVREAAETAGLTEQGLLLSDARKLLSIVRTAASWLALVDSVDKAIERLKQDQLELAAVDYVANFVQDNLATMLTVRLAYAGESGENFDALPCMPFAAYLLELCNGLEARKPPDARAQ